VVTPPGATRSRRQDGLAPLANRPRRAQHGPTVGHRARNLGHRREQEPGTGKDKEEYHDGGSRFHIHGEACFL
jgi:hypothetical protein